VRNDNAFAFLFASLAKILFSVCGQRVLPTTKDRRPTTPCSTIACSIPASMPLKESEAIVLRTYPFRESDLLVTLFTRNEGKVRGAARAAKKSRRRFGGALEPLTYVKVTYEDRERQELARLDACEVLDSPLTSEVTYPRAVAMGHVAELLDELLPDREASDAVFRLAVTVIKQLRGGELWLPVTYFQLWMARLMGYLPELSECLNCGRSLNGSRAFFHALADGVMCPEHKRLASSELSAESRTLAAQMLRVPLAALQPVNAAAHSATDLRKFLLQLFERHIEKKLVTRGMLEKTLGAVMKTGS
jgi:DNA repair protein RecO (recombination protein O)